MLFKWFLCVLWCVVATGSVVFSASVGPDLAESMACELKGFAFLPSPAHKNAEEAVMPHFQGKWAVSMEVMHSKNDCNLSVLKRYDCADVSRLSIFVDKTVCWGDVNPFAIVKRTTRTEAYEVRLFSRAVEEGLYEISIEGNVPLRKTCNLVRIDAGHVGCTHECNAEFSCRRRPCVMHPSFSCTLYLPNKINPCVSLTWLSKAAEVLVNLFNDGAIYERKFITLGRTDGVALMPVDGLGWRFIKDQKQVVSFALQESSSNVACSVEWDDAARRLLLCGPRSVMWLNAEQPIFTCYYASCRDNVRAILSVLGRVCNGGAKPQLVVCREADKAECTYDMPDPCGKVFWTIMESRMSLRSCGCDGGATLDFVWGEKTVLTVDVQRYAVFLKSQGEKILSVTSQADGILRYEGCFDGAQPT